MKNQLHVLSFDSTVVSLVASQAFRSLVLGWGAYVTGALGLTVLFLMLQNTLGVIQTGYLTVLFEPFVLPLIGMCLLSSLFMTLVAGISVARERELGTLETLFYGPVRHREYILGKLLGHVTAYLLMLAVFVIACAALSWWTHLVFSPMLLIVAAVSVFTTVPLIGLGLFSAALMRTVRGTLLFFVGLLLIMLGLPFTQSLLTSIVSGSGFVELIVLRDTLEWLARLVSFFSPISYLLLGVDAFLRQGWLEGMPYWPAAGGYALIIVALTTGLLRRRGVVR